MTTDFEFNEDFRRGYNAALRFYEKHEADLRMALGMAVGERNSAEQKIDEILEARYAALRTPGDFIDRARRWREATERLKGAIC